MSEQSYTLHELTQKAIRELPIRKRIQTRAILMFPWAYRTLMENLRAELTNEESPRVAALGLSTTLLADNFNAFQTQIAINPDLLREILAIILEFLPLFLDLFKGAGSVAMYTILLCLVLTVLAGNTSVANADEPSGTLVCRGDQCFVPGDQSESLPMAPEVEWVSTPIGQPEATPATMVNDVVAATSTEPARCNCSVPSGTYFVPPPITIGVAVKSTARPAPYIHYVTGRNRPVVNTFRRLGSRVRAWRQQYGILPRLLRCR